MKHILWKICYESPPPVIQYCKKCGTRTEYNSSGQFRVNAQKKHLDVWLIYKCCHCDTTWNATIYSRISPQSICGQLLESFHNNDEATALQYAMNTDLLRRNGVQVLPPVYTIHGDDVSGQEPAKITITSDYYFPIKVSAIIREKAKLSQSVLLKWIDSGRIRTPTNQDLRKLKLHQAVTLLFYPTEHCGVGQKESEWSAGDWCSQSGSAAF